MAKKKTTKKATPAKTAPAKKATRRGGRKPGKWELLAQDSVAQFRKAAKLSRNKLAEIVGVSSGSVQNWETGRSVPVKRYQVRLADLISGKAVPSETPAAASGKRGPGRPPRAAASPGPTADASPVEVRVTRLSVTGEIVKGYLATPRGAKLSPEQLVILAASLRGVLV